MKSLRNCFIREGLYETDPDVADVILFNSHHRVDDVLYHKYRYPGKLYIHRVDGPVFLVRGKDKGTDRDIFFINQLVADGTVFQSNWSRMRCIDQGMKPPKYQSVIFNAPDPEIFRNRTGSTVSRRKFRLIATSWSPNEKKGFDIYRYLDEFLDFAIYEMSFIGNAPCSFKNIRCVAPLESAKLADELRRHDIYITGSLDDPCSNSLIEALHCGLPAVARDSGGHPEIIGGGGALFKDTTDVIGAIARVADNRDKYAKSIATDDIINVSGKYVGFFRDILRTGKSDGERNNIVSKSSFLWAKCRLKSRNVAKALQAFGRP